MQFHSWLLARRHRIVLLLEFAWLAALVYATSDGARFFFGDYALFLVGVPLVAGIWFVAVIGSLLRHSQGRLRYVLSLAWPLWWVREPYILAAAFVVWFTPVTFVTRLALSTPFARAAAERVLTSEIRPNALEGRVIGLYLANQVSSTADVVRFRTGPCGFVDDCGFAYGPRGLPAVEGRFRYHHLWGPWWHWLHHF